MHAYTLVWLHVLVSLLTSICYILPSVWSLVQAGHNAMHLAAEGGQLKVIKFLSPTFEARVHEKDSLGWTSLHWAARNGHCEVARYLIEEVKIDPMDKDLVCGVLERRSCVQSAASVYVLMVANTSMYT